jgi:hypothetical protein
MQVFLLLLPLVTLYKLTYIFYYHFFVFLIVKKKKNYEVFILSVSFGQKISAEELNVSVALFSSGCINIIFQSILDNHS